MNPGDLDREILLQQATKTQDVQTGEEVQHWSAAGYTVTSNQIAGVNTVPVTGGHGHFLSGRSIQFSGHATVYTLTATSTTDPATSVAINPALTAPVVAGEVITPSNKIWAQWLPASTREAFQAQARLAAYIDGLFRIYWQSGIAPDTHRIVWENRIFDLKPPIEIGRREGLELPVVARAE
jgi:head-tail adaptor